MFNPMYALFKHTSNGVSFHPNPGSATNPDHLQFFKFVGRVIGKALFEGMYLECHFSKPFYKMMLGEDLTLEDLEDMENSLHQNYKWILENSVEGMDFFFTHDQEYFGKTEEIELCEGGKEKEVTDENKEEYIEKLA